jgi:cytochrome c oxidase subunit 1
VAATAPLQRFITLAAVVTIAGQVVFLVNFFWSLSRGPAAEANPWQATTLEWTLFSPVPRQGFGDHRPVVFHGPYEYGPSATGPDFVMQDAALGST